MSQTIQSPVAPTQTSVPPTATPQTPPPALVVTHTYAAPRERVFKAWTDAGQLSRWFSPTDDYSTKAEVDLRVGGAYRIEITHSSGNAHAVVGTYREIKAPERLSFTWNWEGTPMPETTLVTIEFTPAGNGTQVTMTHEKLPTIESREQHEKGWVGCMSRLERTLPAL
jgi:uncharacterized protein YndB with AHSA1/START domain